MILTYYQAIDLMSSLPTLISSANSNSVINKEMVEESDDKLFTDISPVFNFYDLDDFYSQEH